jgi:hypothetical protein
MPAQAVIKHMGNDLINPAPQIATNSIKHEINISWIKDSKVKYRAKSHRRSYKKHFDTDKKPSKLSVLSLLLFLGAILLGVIGGINNIIFISVISSILFIAGIVLAFVVVFGNENRKSKIIAKIVLIASLFTFLFTMIAALIAIASLGRIF